MDIPNIDLLPHNVSAAIDYSVAKPLGEAALDLAKVAAPYVGADFLAAEHEPDTIAGATDLGVRLFTAYINNSPDLPAAIKPALDNLMVSIGAQIMGIAKPTK